MKQINEAKLLEFQTIGKAADGYLTVGEFPKNLPFEVKRVFWTYHVPNKIIRGQHALKKTEEILIAVSGTIKIKLETPTREILQFDLEKPSYGLYMPIWHWSHIEFSEKAVLLILASAGYDVNEYVRDYSVFEEFCSKYPKRK